MTLAVKVALNPNTTNQAKAAESVEQDKRTYVQSDLALHYPQNMFMVANDKERVKICNNIQSKSPRPCGSVVKRLTHDLVVVSSIPG